MTITVEPVPVPDSQEAAQHPPQAVLDLVEVERAHHRRLYGHEDLVHGVHAVVTGLMSQERTARLRLVARDARGSAVGAAHVTMPLQDNQHLGMFFPSWDPGSGADETEVYDALWAAADPALREAGRTSVQSWAMHPAPHDASGATWLTPQTGTGRVAEDVRARWFTASGFVLEQIELYSVLDHADVAASQSRGEGGDEAGASPYLIRSWVGPTPPELHEGMALLYNRMSVDVPTGGIDYGEEQWDAEQVVADDERAAALGLVRATTVALGPEGTPVAYTVLDHDPDIPASATQEDTLVHGDHRGHGLGLRIKRANLHTLLEAVPGVRRVHTWNAAENSHMLAINTALGFREAGSQGGWQLRR